MTRRSNRHDRHDAPLQRRAAARARSKCGGSAWPGGRALRLQRRAAPTHAAHAAVARKRPPARSCMMISGPPLPTLALGRSAKPALHRASRAARSARSLRQRHPHHQERQRARSRGGAHVGARARSAHAIGAERAARGRYRAAAGARARSAHAIGAERAARGRDRAAAGARGRAARPCHRRRARSARRRWQPAAALCPAQRARSALGAQRGARSARRRSGSLHAPSGAQRPRHLGAERAARGGAARRWQSRRCPTVHSERALCDLIRHDGTTGRLLPASVTPSFNSFFS